MKRILPVLVAAALVALLLASNHTTKSQSYGEEWWNGSWHYRVKLTVDAGMYNRTDWPVEYDANFTQLLESLNETRPLDSNSIRIIEVNDSGDVLHELPSQFDTASGFDQDSNAIGTVAFTLNGSTAGQSYRWFYIYFDITNYPKAQGNYAPIIESSWDGDEFNISFNNASVDYSGFFVFDTNRSENTSGLYQYRLKDEYRFTYSTGGQTTREYIQTTDGTNDLTYDLRGNASFQEGPARIKVHQEGYEVYWNDADNKTNMTYLRKNYYFYPNKTWFVIEHEIININDSAVSRGSYVGISGLDLLGAYLPSYKWSTNYTSDPGTQVSGSENLGTERGGYGHLWENGTSNFRADNYTAGGSPNYDRIGINLSMTTIQPGESIQDRSVMVFYHTVNSPTMLEDITESLINNINVSVGSPEMWVITLDPSPDYDIYNRNESSIMEVNITRDDWSIVDHVNATLDMGTPGAPGDDVTFRLLDDGNFPDTAAGDGYYNAYYNFTDSETTGYWNLTSRAYDKDGGLLNESYYTFNITDEHILDIVIWNYTGIYRLENATVNVTNYRQDIYIPGATMNCTTNEVDIPSGNITDNGDGSYLVTFVTPVEYGLYPLNCSALKDGSWGFLVENYTVEAPETNISLTMSPTSFDSYNVTFFGNESFNLRVTLENIENSTAYDANISLALPANLSSNSTFEECGDILISLFCIRDFNITILSNSVAADYQVDAWTNWTNRILTTGSNTSNITITVHENPVLDVLEENVTGILPPGATSQVIETLDVQSLGNNATLNITFEDIGLDDFSIEFSPLNITTLGPGDTQPVQIIATVPSDYSPGIYEGWINVTSDNGGYEILNTTMIITGTNVTLTANPGDYNANYVTAFSNESFEFHVNVTNYGNSTAFGTYLDLSLPPGWYINSTTYNCGNMSRNTSCFTTFFVNITELTYAGDYLINLSLYWEDIGIAWRNENASVNVTVVQNVTLEVVEDSFTYFMEHGTNAVIGNLTLRSTGNDNVTGIDFNFSSEFDSFTITLNQSYPFSMYPGDLRTVEINTTAAAGFDPGEYLGTLNVTSSNDGYKPVTLNITVPQNGSWTVNTTYCDHAQSPNTGTVCSVLINNTGNILLNFTIDPAGGANHSTPSNATLNISKQTNAVLTIFYDMGGDAGTGFFLTNYTIAPNQTAGIPDNITLEIVLNPYVEPLVEIGITPNLTKQAGVVEFVVNVTSQSGAVFDDVLLTVERPNGTNDTMALGFGQQVFWVGCDFIIDDPGDKLCYVLNYPGTLPGNSTDRGNYTVYVFANDTYAVNTTNASIYQVYARYMSQLTMPDTTAGSWESLGFRSQDYLGAPLGGSDVNLTIRDPDNRTVYMLTGSEYVTDSSGWVAENIFVIPTHATPGEYTIYSNGTYYDSQIGIWTSNETTATFNVSEDQELKAKVGIPSPSYVDNTMAVSVIVLDNYYEPIDPDAINLTIYYTEGYDLSVWRSLDIGDFTHTGTGFYKYQEVLSSVLTGSYLALLRVNLDDRETYDIQPFRIASGGPYDVFLDLTESEVAAGNPLDFDITIWNKGEIDHVDVVATYWVTGNGQTWDSSSFSTNILGGENKTFSRTAFIYSNQPPGFYNLNAEVLYDPNQPPATANITFLVTGEAPPDDDGGGGGDEGGGGAGGEGGGGGAAAGQINITDAPDQVGAMIGRLKQFNVGVEASGGSVSNVWLEFRGIPEDWVVIEPNNMSSIGAGESRFFSVEILVPRGESGERQVTIVAHSTESEDEWDFDLRIFTSREDLINFELTRLRAKLAELRDRAEKAKEAGFDIYEVEDLLDDAEKEIELAEGYMREELYDPALKSVGAAWTLLDKAEDLLDRMLAGLAVPWWMIIFVLAAIVIAGLLFLYRKISKNLRMLVRGRLSEARQVAGTIKSSGTEVTKLREEKGKTERMLLLLTSQYKSGIISKEAYESLKTRSDEKIAELDKKIRESIKG